MNLSISDSSSCILMAKNLDHKSIDHLTLKAEEYSELYAVLAIRCPIMSELAWTETANLVEWGMRDEPRVKRHLLCPPRMKINLRVLLHIKASSRCLKNSIDEPKRQSSQSKKPVLHHRTVSSFTFLPPDTPIKQYLKEYTTVHELPFSLCNDLHQAILACRCSMSAQYQWQYYLQERSYFIGWSGEHYTWSWFSGRFGGLILIIG